MLQALNIITSGIIILFSLNLNAQVSNGSASGNFLHTANVKHNPATILKAEWMVSPITLEMGIYNNFLKLDMPFSPTVYAKNATNNTENSAFDFSWIQYHQNAKTLKLNLYVQAQLFTTAIKHKNWTYGISQDYHFYTRISGVPTAIVKSALSSILDSNSSSFELNPDELKLINVFINRYRTTNFNVAYLFKLKYKHQFSIGLTYKLIVSQGAYNFIYKNNVKMENTEVFFSDLRARNNKNKPHGIGGLDIGAVYIYQTPIQKQKPGFSKKHTDYKFRFGIAILDLGKQVYTRTINQHLIVNTSLIANPSKLSNNKLINIETTYGKKIKVGLPSRINWHIDYQAYKHLFVYVGGSHSLSGYSNLFNMRIPGYLLINPRYESKYFEVNFPLTIRNNAPNANLGLGIRFFHIYFNTHNLNAIVNLKKASEIGLFFGFEISNIKGKVIKRKGLYMRINKRKCAEF